MSLLQRSLLLLACSALLWNASGKSEDAGQAPARSDPTSPAEINRLIRQLISEQFTEREAAIKALEAMEEPAWKALRQALRNAASTSDDIELRLRARGLFDKLNLPELRRFVGNPEEVSSVAFSPDGKQALSGGADRLLRLWDVQTGKELRRFMGHTEAVSSVAFGPDGKQALSGSRDSTLRLWDVQTGKELRRFTGHKGAVNSVAFHPDGKRALSGGVDGAVRLWNVQTGKERPDFFSGHNGAVTCVAFSPDGKQALSGGVDHSLRLWDMKKGRAISYFQGHTGSITSVAFSPDGEWVLSGGADSTLRLWSVDASKEIQRFNGHNVMSVAFHPDGRRALSGGADGSVRVRDVQTGEELRCFKEHTSAVRGVAFSPDGKRALTGGRDKTVRLWRMYATGPAARRGTKIEDVFEKDENSPGDRAAELRKLLDRTVDYAGLDDPKATLIDELDRLSRVYRVTFDVNEEAFKADKVEDVLRKEIANPNAIPAMKTSLETVLKKILARVQAPSRATLLLRKDVLEITTEAAIRQELKLPPAKRDETGQLVDRLPPLAWADFRKVPLQSALSDLASATQTNIVLDPRVEKKAEVSVTARLANVPVDVAVRLLADMAGLSAVPMTNVYYVTSPENAAKLQSAAKKDDRGRHKRRN